MRRSGGRGQNPAELLEVKVREAETENESETGVEKGNARGTNGRRDIAGLE